MRTEFDRKDLMNMGHTPYGYRIENGNAVIEPKGAEAVVKICFSLTRTLTESIMILVLHLRKQ